jgi:hypothetical protein
MRLRSVGCCESSVGQRCMYAQVSTCVWLHWLNNISSLNFDGFTRPPVVRPWGVRWRARVPYPCSLNAPSLQDAGPMGDQNPMAYVHKGGVRILSYLI